MPINRNEHRRLQVASLVKPKPEPELNVLADLCREIDTGGLSVLSEAARDRIKLYLQQAMADGYNRGYNAGYDKAGEEAAIDAAGESI